MFLYAVGFGIVTAMVGAGGGRVDRPVRVTNILNLANGYVTTGSAFVAYVSYSAGPLLGDVESGLAASLIGVRGAIVSGGLLCVAGVAVVALAMPALWRYRPADI